MKNNNTQKGKRQKRGKNVKLFMCMPWRHNLGADTQSNITTQLENYN